MIGRTLSHFKLTEKLGEGGMGEVYLAEDLKLGRQVALKVLPRDLATRGERLQRFQREARALAALDHPNIVHVYSIEQVGEVHFLTMQRVRGEELSARIPAGGMQLGDFFDLAIPLADALSRAHETGVIHRDLKPANVMVDETGQVKVLDFGLAKLRTTADSDPASTVETEVLTGEGRLLGTAAYMSPEQAIGREAGPQSDQFSLGVVYYEMLCGTHPFRAATPAATLAAILRDEPPAIEGRRDDLPPDLTRLVGRCLDKQPGARYPALSDVVRELEELREGERRAPYLPSRSGEVIADPEAPWVGVRPFVYRGTDAELVSFSEGLSEDVSTLLSRFPYLLVASADSEADRDPSTSHYWLRGTVRGIGGRVRVNVQLIEGTSGRQLWAETYDRHLGKDGIFEIQDDLVHRIVATVADAQGVLSRSIAARVAGRAPQDLNPYEALLRTFVYAQHLTEEEHEAARSALERAVESRPTYAEAWAALAMLILDEVRIGFNPRPESLVRARRAAERATSLDRASQLAHRALAEVHLAEGDLAAFRAAAERAVELNPYDTENVAGLGAFIAATGEWERGLEICDRAMDLNPHHPPWYRLPRFFDCFRQGRYEEALAIAKSLDMPGFLWTHICAAIAHAELGDRAAAENEVESLLELVPDFVESGEAILDQWLWGDLRQRVVEALEKAGLAFRQP